MKLHLLLLCLFSSWATLNAQALGCLEGNCTNGYGVYNNDEEFIVGPFKDGKLNGVGKVMYNNDTNDFYQGEFVNDVYSGFGTRVYANGDRYMGGWLNGKYHGFGVFMKKDGLVQTGYFKEGSIVNEQIGISSAANEVDNTKTGCLEGDCANGYGTFRWKTGAVYIGTWKYDKKHGIGLYTSVNSISCSEYAYDQFEGYGSKIYIANQETYFGEWKEGKKEGEGILVLKDQTLKKGQWKNNELVK